MIRLLASAAHREAEAATRSLAASPILAAIRGTRTATLSAGRLPRLTLLAVAAGVAVESPLVEGGEESPAGLPGPLIVPAVC